ncbi:ATP-binding SpoIIE family protein phosphatase [Streptomyces sp. NPDC048845]|uniref:ATP-binding SpoIIE family protein phosphatase n=1 Tax=Streptomyces sp. NPDC048845 TaxID=3155390 RepID=UPI00343D4B07
MSTQRTTAGRPMPPSGGPAGDTAVPAAGPGGVRPVLRTSLPGNSLGPGAARRFVRAALADWTTQQALPAAAGITGRLADDATLLVSELVTNAVLHAGTQVEVLCRLDGAEPEPSGEPAEPGPAALVVEVSDHHPARDVHCPRGTADGTSGRGLRLVGAVAEAWGVTYHGGLKTVWFRLPVADPDDPALPELAPPEDRALQRELRAADILATEPRPDGDREPGTDWVSRGALFFLAEASDLFAGEFDEDRVAGLAGQLLVPRLADWCAVWLDQEGGGASARLARVLHTSESRVEGLRSVLEKNPPVVTEAARGWPVPWPWPVIPPAPVDGAALPGPHAPGGTTGGEPPGEGGTVRTTANGQPPPAAGTALACRLIAGGRGVGTLLLGKAGPVRTADEVTALIADFARRVALAVASARQYTRQATMSAILQRGLLPARISTVPGIDHHVVYEPAGEGAAVGGDLYDLFRASDGRWFFALGDVGGHGPEAAVVTGLVRPIVKLLAQEGYGAAGVLRRLNRLLCDHAAQAAKAAAAAATGTGPGPVAAGAAALVQEEATPMRLVSLLCGELEPETGDDGKVLRVRCTVASAGHPLPLLLRPDGAVRQVAASHVLLGVLDDAEYESETFDLEPGDTLLCVTDGVTERRSGRHQFDDGDGLSSALSGCAGLGADGVARRIRQVVHEFADQPPDDDLSLLVLQAT